MTTLPTYTLEIWASKARTPERGKELTEEEYDIWIKDPNHERFEKQCQEGRIHFWQARIMEYTTPDAKPTSVVVHDNPFDTSQNNGTVQLREFLKRVSKCLYQKSQKTIGVEKELVNTGIIITD